MRDVSGIGVAGICGAAVAAFAILDARLGTGAVGGLVACGAAVATIVACAPRRRAGARSTGMAHPTARPWRTTVAAGAAALACAGAGAILGGPSLAVLAILALVGGALAGSGTRAVAAGVALALVPYALARVAGDTASLSSIDVALAHRMAESVFGIGAAVATAVARLGLLPVAAVTGHVAARALHSTGRQGSPHDSRRRRRDGDASRGWAVLAAVQLGAGFAFAAALASGSTLGDPMGDPLGDPMGNPMDGPVPAVGIDVALAHRMAESVFGIGAAVATAVARLGLLPIAAVAGHVVARALHSAHGQEPRHDPRSRSQGRDASRGWAMLAAVQLGAGFTFAAALAAGFTLGDPLGDPADGRAAVIAAGAAVQERSGTGVPFAAAGLGGLLRELDLAVWLWLAAAAGTGLTAATTRRQTIEPDVSETMSDTTAR